MANLSPGERKKMMDEMADLQSQAAAHGGPGAGLAAMMAKMTGEAEARRLSGQSMPSSQQLRADMQRQARETNPLLGNMFGASMRSDKGGGDPCGASGFPARSGGGGSSKLTQAIFLLSDARDGAGDQEEADSIMAKWGGSVTNEFSEQLYFSADALALERTAGLGMVAKLLDSSSSSSSSSSNEKDDFAAAETAINSVASALSSTPGALAVFCAYLGRTPCLDGKAASALVDKQRLSTETETDCNTPPQSSKEYVFLLSEGPLKVLAYLTAAAATADCGNLLSVPSVVSASRACSILRSIDEAGGEGGGGGGEGGGGEGSTKKHMLRRRLEELMARKDLPPPRCTYTFPSKGGVMKKERQPSLPDIAKSIHNILFCSGKEEEEEEGGTASRTPALLPVVLGAKVVVHGLSSRPSLNDCSGVVEGFSGDRVIVFIESQASTIKAKDCNLRLTSLPKDKGAVASQAQRKRRAAQAAQAAAAAAQRAKDGVPDGLNGFQEDLAKKWSSGGCVPPSRAEIKKLTKEKLKPDHLSTDYMAAASKLKEKGNDSFASKSWKEAVGWYTQAALKLSMEGIDANAAQYGHGYGQTERAAAAVAAELSKIFGNRCTCHMKSGDPVEALTDAQSAYFLDHTAPKSVPRVNSARELCHRDVVTPLIQALASTAAEAGCAPDGVDRTTPPPDHALDRGASIRGCSLFPYAATLPCVVEVMDVQGLNCRHRKDSGDKGAGTAKSSSGKGKKGKAKKGGSVTSSVDDVEDEEGEPCPPVGSRLLIGAVDTDVKTKSVRALVAAGPFAGKWITWVDGSTRRRKLVQYGIRLHSLGCPLTTQVPNALPWTAGGTLIIRTEKELTAEVKRRRDLVDADTVAGGCRRVKRSERDIIKSNYVSLSEDSTCNFREKAVITAVARGDVDGALTLVTLYGHDVNERDGIGWTPAINLCNDKDPALLQDGSGLIDDCRALQSCGADMKALSQQGQHCLLHAARNGLTDVVKYLHEECGCSVDQPTVFGDTPLMGAASWGHNSTVKYLLKAGADMYAVNGSDAHALNQASEKGHVEVMRTIIAAGHSRDRFDPETNDSAGFHKVVSGGSVRSGILGMLSHNRFIKGLELMMSKGANMNSTQHLENPLIIAINDGDQRCQFALIESGEADLGVSLYSGSTPLNQAIHKGDRALVKKLLAARADPNLCCTYNGHSALFSAYNSDDSIVRSLLKYGGDPSSKDRHNAPALMMHIQSDRSDSLLGEMLNTPSVKADSSFLNDPISLNGVATGDRLLTVATHSNRPNLIKMLIMAGADVNIPNNKGCTPLVVACQFNFVSAAKVLIESGANVDQQDCHGEPGLADKMSCVHFAVCSGHEELLRLLIASGANLHIANSAGTKPLEFASHVLQSGNTTIRKGLNTCVALLKEAHLKEEKEKKEKKTQPKQPETKKQQSSAAVAETTPPVDEATGGIPLLCAHCLSAAGAGVKYKKCGGCQCVFYCGAKCQKAHWKQHKTVCAELAERD